MRITGVEIANYRGFAGESFRLTLEQGENLLVYGENGAGKSSFYNSLKDFLQAANNKRINIEQHRNRDNTDGGPVVAITTLGTITQWSTATRDQDNDHWRNVDDGKGFLDYKSLLRFYQTPKDKDGKMDLFNFVLTGLLAHYRMTVGGETFLKTWRSIESKFGYGVRLHWRTCEELQRRVMQFNANFRTEVDRLAERATEMLRFFDPKVIIRFIITDAKYFEAPKCLEMPTITAQPERILAPSDHTTGNPERTEPIPNYDDFFVTVQVTAAKLASR